LTPRETREVEEETPNRRKTNDSETFCYAYIVRCRDGTLYTGWTDNLEKRMKAHNEGKGGRYTQARRPVVLAYYEEFASKKEAMSREWAIKKKTRAAKQRLIDVAPPQKPRHEK
jgi:putative endonuclease